VARLLTVAAGLTAAAYIVGCAAYSFPTPSRDGILGGTFLGSAARGRTTLGELMSGAPGTYIDRILADRDSTIERWTDRVDEPLRVWIDSSSTIGGAQAGFPAAVRAAMSDWETTGIPVRFAYVRRASDADIRVRWTEHLEHKTGSTTWRTDRRGWLVSSDITLATHISDGSPLDAYGMKAIALHEVGHALGLSHSDSPHDIMAPLVRTDSLSTPDRNTIKLLYSFQAGRVVP
jgi:predicted Zn-dependent protease